MQGYIRNYRSKFKLYGRDGKFYCYNTVNRKSELYDTLKELMEAIDNDTVKYIEEEEPKHDYFL